MKYMTFGESHGPGMGVVIEGCPAGIRWNHELLQSQMERRRPGQSPWVTSRQEPDEVEVLSGVFEGVTLGTPIALMVRNKDARSEDYKEIKSESRRGHADDLWKIKFGHSDPRGGGRASGRETVARVMLGAVSQMLVQTLYSDVKVISWVSAVGPVELTSDDLNREEENLLFKPNYVDQFPARIPDQAKSEFIKEMLLKAKEVGESYGGKVQAWIEKAPIGLGQPVFRKLKSDMAQALMSIGAVNGVEFGEGFAASRAKGTEFHAQSCGNPYGGIRGGLSTGERISWTIGFKPTSSILDVAKKGRHDPCIVPRAVPVIEAMLWTVLAEHILLARGDQI